MFLLYLLKVSACVLGFYTLYLLAFRKFTFFGWNRGYLMASLVLSFLIPMIKLEETVVMPIQSQEPESEAFNGQYILPNQDFSAINQLPIQDISEPFDWQNALLFLYFLGVTLFLIKLIFSLYKVYQRSRNAIRLDKYSIIEGCNENASFFNVIFLNVEGLSTSEKEQIIAHEATHARLLHSIDILILAICKVVLWFNPVIYYFKKSLSQIHEYEVDTVMIRDFDSKNYAYLLLKLGTNPHISLLTNQFSTHPLKDRIQFLFSKRTKFMKKLFYVFVLPLIGISVWAFAGKTVKVVYEDVKNKINENDNNQSNSKKKEEKLSLLSSIIDETKNDEKEPFDSTRYSSLIINQIKDKKQDVTGYVINKANLLKIKPDGIEYYVSPDKANKQDFDKVATYFENLGFILKTTDFQYDSNKKLVSFIASISNREEEFKLFYNLEKMRHLVQFKNETPQRWDETIIIKAFTDTKDVKLGIENTWLRAILKSKNYKELSISDSFVADASYDTQAIIPSEKYLNGTWYRDKRILSVTFPRKDKPFNTIRLTQNGHNPKFRVSADSKILFLGRDYELNIDRTKIKIINPEIINNAKEIKVEYLYDDLKNLPFTTKNIPLSDSIRTIISTHKLGKNPLVLINGIEYPASVLYRIDPRVHHSNSIYPPNSEIVIKKYGEKARDGVLVIDSSDDLFLKSDLAYQTVMENIRRELAAPAGHLVRIQQLNEDKTTYDKVIVRNQDGSVRGAIEIKTGGEVFYAIDGKQVSESDIRNYNGKLIGISCWEIKGDGAQKIGIEGKYGKVALNYLAGINVQTK